MSLEKKGDIEGAIAEYKLAIQENPGNADSHYNLAQLLAGKQDYAAAIAQSREGVEDHAE